MSEVQTTGLQFHVILTPHEFVLVTKALMGTISDEPEERLTPDSPRADGKNKGKRKVEVNDKEDARDLGIRLMERRRRCAEKELERVNIHMEQAIKAMSESQKGGA